MKLELELMVVNIVLSHKENRIFVLFQRKSGVEILLPGRCAKIREILQRGGHYHNPEKQMALMRVMKGKRR